MEFDTFIIDTLKTLLTLLGVTFSDIAMVRDEKMQSTRFVITTPDSPILIGEHGARLHALNHLMKRIAEKHFQQSFMVDVNDYQKKHIDEIISKAHIFAERARYFKSSVEMDPMSSYERMIVHAEFSDIPDIVTESSGFGKERHLVLKYTESKEIPNLI
jgi:spoIIIJ-associated protein